MTRAGHCYQCSSCSEWPHNVGIVTSILWRLSISPTEWMGHKPMMPALCSHDATWEWPWPTVELWTHYSINLFFLVCRGFAGGRHLILLNESISWSVWKLAHERRGQSRDKPPEERRHSFLLLWSWEALAGSLLTWIPNSSWGPVRFVSYPLNPFFLKLIWIGLTWPW